MRLGPVPIVRWQLGNAGFRPAAHQSPRLAEGRMSAPAVTPAALAALQKALGEILDVVAREIAAVEVEFDLVSPAAVRADPTASKEISYIGQLPHQEVRSALLVASRELGNVLRRIQSGSLASYLSTDQAGTLEALRGQSDRLVAALQNQDLQGIASGHQADVQAYLDMHLASAANLLRSTEKGVVVAEAGSVPVIEPSERKLSTTTIVAGVGVAAGIGIVLWLLV